MIWLIRHGEAAAGWGDHADPGLSDLGHRQAEATAAILAPLSVRRLVSSPMQRCRETSAPTAKQFALSPVIAPEVSEITAPAGTEDRASWLRGIMTGTWSDAGETYIAWRRRAGDFVEALPEGTVVFSHFVAINALCGLFENDDRVTVFRPGHCSITRLERRGGALRVAEYGSEAATRVL